MLLLGKDDQIQALLPNARLHLARGDFPLASATARRGLRLIGRDRLRAVELLGVLVEAELGRGDNDSASAAIEELHTRLSLAGTPGSRAEAARLHGKVLVAQGRLAAAVDLMRVTLAELGDETCLLARLALHLELANSLEQSDAETAAIDARAAFALLARLDVVLAPAEQLLLSRFGLPAAHGPIPRRQVASLSLAGGS